MLQPSSLVATVNTEYNSQWNSGGNAMNWIRGEEWNGLLWIVLRFQRFCVIKREEEKDEQKNEKYRKARVKLNWSEAKAAAADKYLDVDWSNYNG